jgi:predicted  nucleic acid-binding Zn-ribbon protein
MLDALKIISEIQEYDMKMIRLMRLKAKRQHELDDVIAIKKDLQLQITTKEADILEQKKEIRLAEGEIEDVKGRLKELEAKQSTIKKAEEFSALSHEVSQLERERMAKEQRASDLLDQLAVFENSLESLKESLHSTEESSRGIENEIQESIRYINQEGRELKELRDSLVAKADPEIFKVYERLLRNKKDRVLVALENRCCSGCHIQVTAQHENLVRKGERLVFCEHCSRIHYWPEASVVAASSEETEESPKRRRRTKASA